MKEKNVLCENGHVIIQKRRSIRIFINSLYNFTYNFLNTDTQCFDIKYWHM